MVSSKNRFKRSCIVCDELLCSGCPHHVRAHSFIESVKFFELRNPKRIGQEPAISHHIGVCWKAILKSEALNSNTQTGIVLRRELLDDCCCELVNVQIRSVNDDVAAGTNLSHPPAFRGNSVERSALLLKRMWSSDLFKATHQCGIFRVKK